MIRGRLAVHLLTVGAVAIVFLSAGCATRGEAPRTTQRRRAATDPSGSLWTLSDRGIKSDLIVHMKSPPGLLVLGGSRALRFRTRLYQAGSPASPPSMRLWPHATPQDEWCFVNLFTSRFPRATFSSCG